MYLYTKEELLDKEDSWMDREDMDEGDERNYWLEEGIELYKHFIKMEPKEVRYAITLADLYLQFGRDEKIRRGNYRNAYNILRLATIHAPNKPDAFYHISFILANEERKWEAVLFYAKEALENGIQGTQKLKLLCNMGVAYHKLGYVYKAINSIKMAHELDQRNEHHWFISLYADQLKRRKDEPILLKGTNEGRKTVSKSAYNEIKEKAMDGECIALDLSVHETYFYADNDAVRLERKEAEVLGFLMDYQGSSCSKQKIQEAVWLEQKVSPTVVKRYISSLRKKLLHAMSCEDIQTVLATTEDGYEWKGPIHTYVLR